MENGLRRLSLLGHSSGREEGRHAFGVEAQALGLRPVKVHSDYSDGLADRNGQSESHWGFYH